MFNRMMIGCAVAALASMTMAMTASASVIEFMHEGVGSGTLDGQPFGVGAPVPFVINAFGETDDRVSFGNGFAIQHTSASITIDGVGTFDFLTLTRTFVNNSNDTVGFSRSVDGGQGGEDLYNGPTDPVFAGWDMLSSIGPVAGNDGWLLQWGFADVVTTGGVLFFNNQTGVPVIFTATVLPAPGALALLGVAGLVTTRRRRG